MYFKNRRDAGKRLCQLLAKYQDKDAVVYALPRGGIVLAVEVAKFLHVPLDLVFAHKIGHPYQPEYAIAAISESGHMLGKPHELKAVGEAWVESEKESQMQEIKRRRKVYLKGQKAISAKGKIAILIDDGIATGLTMQVGIRELQDQHRQAIVVAVPVAPKQTADLLKAEVDDFVAIEIPDDYKFLGSVGAYYGEFDQVEDAEVVAILDNYAKEYAKQSF